MQEDYVLEILNDWNLWRKNIESGVTREAYLKRALELLDSNMVVTIIGIRRAGKSFLTRQIAKELAVPSKNTLMINFEDMRFGSLNDSDLEEIFQIYLKNLNPEDIPYIFLDEVHRVKNWEKWVRTTHELRRGKVIVTSSTSHLLKNELSTLLTGRHLDVEVFPLSFKEFLNFKGIKIRNKLDIAHKKLEIKRALDEYTEFGGFPEVTLSQSKKEILITYFEDIITKDIVQRYKILKVDKLLNLARFYLTNISSPITFNSAKKSIDLSVDTIKTFSTYLQSVYLIIFIKRFSYKIKEQEKSPRKVYSIDVGISNAIGFRFSENKGKLMENIVLVELMRKKSETPMEIYYWKDEQNKEVDFILKEGKSLKQIIQVTYASSRDEVKEGELKALNKASKALKCENLLCITWEYEDEVQYKDNTIRFTPLWKWLLTNNK